MFPLWPQAVTTRFFIHLLPHVLQSPEPVASFCRTWPLQASRLGLSTSHSLDHRSISSEIKISLSSRRSSYSVTELLLSSSTSARLVRIFSTLSTFTQNRTLFSFNGPWLSTFLIFQGSATSRYRPPRLHRHSNQVPNASWRRR